MSLPRRAGLRGLRRIRHSEEVRKRPRKPLLGFHSPSEVGRASSRYVRAAPEARTIGSPSHGIWTPTAYAHAGKRLSSVRACLARTTNAFRFSQPRGALPPRASRPYFIPAPLMGFALQSFAPPAQPYAVSGALSPHDVGNARCDLTTGPGSRCRHPKMLASAKPESVRPVRHSPSSGSCSTRESATRRGLFRPTPARSSPGPSPLQGVLPQLDGRGLHRASPHAVRCPGASGRCTSTPGSCSSRGWLVSLETADPPGVPRLLVLHNRLR
jgi:hypothetical protein